jgi:hypothetical protein
VRFTVPELVNVILPVNVYVIAAEVCKTNAPTDVHTLAGKLVETYCLNVMVIPPNDVGIDVHTTAFALEEYQRKSPLPPSAIAPAILNVKTTFV